MTEEQLTQNWKLLCEHYASLTGPAATPFPRFVESAYVLPREYQDPLTVALRVACKLFDTAKKHGCPDPVIVAESYDGFVWPREFQWHWPEGCNWDYPDHTKVTLTIMSKIQYVQWNGEEPKLSKLETHFGRRLGEVNSPVA